MKQEFPHIDAKKSLGQHFLNNARVPELMAEAGDVQAGDVVLEMGPGTGILTQTLLSRGAHVIALEADARAIEVLKNTYASQITAQKLTLMHTDVRSLDLSTVVVHPQNYKVVANIPYYLSGMLFRAFLETSHQPKTLVFLVQKEVAERIARNTKESLLSLSVKVFGDPQYVQTVKRGNFTPPPQVDSVIIAISNISKQRLGSIPETFFFEVLHEGFKSKRKQLLGNLSDMFPRAVLTHIFSTRTLPLDVRGEDLTLPEWLGLIEALIPHKKSTEYLHR